MNIERTVSVLIVPANIPCNMKVRGGERPAKRLEACEATARAERIVGSDDLVLRVRRYVAAASEEPFPQHALRTESRLGRRHVSRRAVGIEKIENWIRPLRR